ITKSPPKMIQAKAKRRNTMDSIYFNELLEKSENTTEQEIEQPTRPENNKRNKRNMKLLRGSERDLKLDISSIDHAALNSEQNGDDRAESMPVITPQPAIKVETCNRFMSLTSKLVACRNLKKQGDVKLKTELSSDKRLEFYSVFSNLIRMGSADKQTDKNPRRHLSREEHMWQNELKDLIWLELQAWHSDRTPMEQDEYLCKAREGVQDLLDDIMNFRRKKYLHLNHCQTVVFIRPPGPMSTQSSDSGISGVGSTNSENRDDCCEPMNPSNRNSNYCMCSGCLSMYCHSCLEIQNQALKEVENKSFGVQHPLYKCPQFVGRVKAMCLWYNMTKHHRLKMLIIGKIMYLHQPKNYSWPPVGPLNEDDPTLSSGRGTDTSEDSSYQDLRRTSRSGSIDGKPSRCRNRTVQFDLDASGSPSDSNNSNLSHGTNATSSSEGGMDFAEYTMDFYNASMLASMGSTFCVTKEATYPYRKYMEEVLKTRGLRKAIHFLEKLHSHVLQKAMITLEKPVDSDFQLSEVNNTKDKHYNFKAGRNPSTDQINTLVEIEMTPPEITESDEEEELRRYGYWSPEAQSLGLPSYRSAFLFLSRIPLEMFHEFLRLRLEQKPVQPSVLSIRQLMRELKEGLRIAVLQRQRYLSLIQTVLWDKDQETRDLYEDVVNEFVKTMKAVLKVYLDYVQQWVMMVQQEGYQKNLLEEEWCFVKTTCPKIPGGEGMASDTFCHIASSMLASIGEQLLARAKQLKANMCNGDISDDELSPKHAMLMVCREFQILFNETREKALKAIAFSKTLRKDLEDSNFKEGISPECNFVIAQSLEELK
ncbi:hypothetical protein L9F63_026746, partial [Diploptera punctata]